MVAQKGRDETEQSFVSVKFEGGSKGSRDFEQVLENV
jgi:hypothetical protein